MTGRPSAATQENLELSMLETSPQPERMAWLAQVVPGLEGSGVNYVLTVADTTRVASFLRTQGIDAHAYSGERAADGRGEHALTQGLDLTMSSNMWASVVIVCIALIPTSAEFAGVRESPSSVR